MKPRYDQNQISKEINKMRRKFNDLVGQKREIEKRLDDIKTLDRRIDEAISTTRSDLRKLNEIYFIQNGVPKKIAKLREKIISEILFSQRKDVKVSESEKASKNIKKDKEELQKICPHQFIVTREDYEGSSSYDYDDARREGRICVVCGFTEASKDSPEEPYSGVLTDKDNRLVKRNGNFFESLVEKYHDVFSKELDYFLELFLNSAGGFGYLDGDNLKAK